MCVGRPVVPTKAQVLHLYRALLKLRTGFKYTDKEFYTNRIRREFQGRKELADPVKLAKSYEVSLTIISLCNLYNVFQVWANHA